MADNKAMMAGGLDFNRRDFIKTAGLTVSALAFTGAARAYGQGTERIGVGLIGCGGRGSGAALDCLAADPAVEIVAMGDLFADRLSQTLDQLKKEKGDRIKVTPATSYVGFDAYRKVIETPGVVMIIDATPPHFRPGHLKAAIEGGKHVFMEKPAGVCPVGIKMVMAAGELAAQKGLSIVAGTQRRHSPHYKEIMKRVHDGQIGKILSAQCYWCGGDMLGYWKWWERKDCKSDMEWQCRSWPWFTWTSGDHIVEQHVHNIDIINWAIGSHPVSAMGMGGRQVRDLGNIWDHFAIELEYPGGIKVTSMSRQINGCTNRVSEVVTGIDGEVYSDSNNGFIKGKNPFKYEGENPNPYVQEHVDLIAAIRSGKPVNEARQVAESTMTAILGRMSAYTGQAIKWDWAMNASKLDLTPPQYDWIVLPVEPVATPGKTQII